MSLRTKIIFSFVISSAIVAFFAVFAFLTFTETRKQIRNLELSDTIRSKSLQLRRHEKNFFLYMNPDERKAVEDYISQLKEIIGGELSARNEEDVSMPRIFMPKGADTSVFFFNRRGYLLWLESNIEEYEQIFGEIEKSLAEFQDEFGRLKSGFKTHAGFFPLIESTVLERPLVNMKVLEMNFRLGKNEPALRALESLGEHIALLRKYGEDIILISKELDSVARERAESSIALSQTIGLILIPLFFIGGLGALFVIGQSITGRLKALTAGIEKTGKGDFKSLPVSTEPTAEDEVGLLVRAFNEMERNLIARDEELHKKTEELLRSRKLASIGTLASGVAHELNNPLNNIYLAAQILSKETGKGEFPPVIKDTVSDIFSQTLRVKRIVADLLAFAREKTPELKEIDISSIVRDVVRNMTASGGLAGVTVEFTTPGAVILMADRALFEQVFINLFTNAVDAMDGIGTLAVEIKEDEASASIRVADTGKGIPPENIQRVFDPFFTTKEKGTGLGLAIVYNIIEKHGGKIELESQPGKGTAFTLILPKKP